LRLSATLFLALAAVSPARAGGCPVPGPRIQWLADYCMYKVESDDIVAAYPCMNEEGKRRFGNDCEAKKHYKRQICRIAKEPEQSEDECVRDPAFMGPTVRNNGVGG